MDPIGHKTRRGLSWNLAGAVVTNGMRLVVLVVLGRLLTSTEFGIVAAAVSVNAIVHGVRDIGIGPALVQRKTLEPGHLTTAFAVSLYLGVGLSVILVAGAGAIGAVFRIPESVDAIRALAGLFVLRSVAVVSNVRCRREMNFRAIAIIDAASFTAGSILSIVAAYLGAGAWALIAGYLAEELLSTVMYLITAPPVVAFQIDRARLRELLGFGAGQTVVQLANMAAMYGDNVVVGRALGPALLGYYARAYDLVKFPAMVFDMIVGTVLFPAFSRIQDDKENLAAGLRRGTFANTLLMAPASVALVVLAPEVIRILMGPDWDAAVAPFQVFAVTVGFRTAQRIAALVAQAAGAVNAVALATVSYVLCVVGGAMFTVRWGISAVAVSTVIAIAVVHIECSYLALRVSRLAPGALLRAYGPGVTLALATGAVSWPLTAGLRAAGLAAPVVLVATLLVAIGACLAIVALWIRSGRGDFAWLGDELRRFRPRRA